MRHAAIHAEGVGKEYRLGQREQYLALRDVLAESFTRNVRRLAPWREGHQTTASSADATTIRALQDVSFDVSPGEVLGVIGRNGAGKSTLLKILSRITKPSEGSIVIRGRVGSLLEVGTGFHPELTGRENIQMSGAILGMSKTDIKRKFDEIVAFAEVERFIDTPVKRYSNGMYMRLAFAVAAHLEPDIVIVDEVLAVGDAEFQKKCLGALRDASSHLGRTVLFVSHNMHAVQRLCTRCMLLESGRIAAIGNPSSVIAQYLASVTYASQSNTWIQLTPARRGGNGEARLVALRYTSRDSTAGYQPYPSGPLDVTVLIESNAERSIGSLALTLSDPHGTKLIHVDSAHMGHNVELQCGHNLLRLHIDHLYLNPGIYLVSLRLARPGGTVYDALTDVLELEVVNLDARWAGRSTQQDGTVVCHFSVDQEPIDDIHRSMLATLIPQRVR